MFEWLTAPIASTVSGVLGYSAQEETNKANQANAQAQMDFQERMSNSAYQRQVKDMESAGLNPMLAYVKGGGASSPSGSMATYQNPATSGVQAALGTAQVANTQASTRQTSAQTDYLTGVQTDLSFAELKKVEQATDMIKAQIDQIKGDTHFETQQNKLKATAYMIKQQGDNYQEQGMTTGKQRAVMEETIANLKKDGQLKDLDLKAAKAFDNFGRTSKELLPVIEVMKSILLPRGIR